MADDSLETKGVPQTVVVAGGFFISMSMAVGIAIRAGRTGRTVVGTGKTVVGTGKTVVGTVVGGTVVATVWPSIVFFLFRQSLLAGDTEISIEDMMVGDDIHFIWDFQ